MDHNCYRLLWLIDTKSHDKAVRFILGRFKQYTELEPMDRLLGEFLLTLFFGRHPWKVMVTAPYSTISNKGNLYIILLIDSIVMFSSILCSRSTHTRPRSTVTISSSSRIFLANVPHHGNPPVVVDFGQNPWDLGTFCKTFYEVSAT